MNNYKYEIDDIYFDEIFERMSGAWGYYYYWLYELGYSIDDYYYKLHYGNDFTGKEAPEFDYGDELEVVILFLIKNTNDKDKIIKGLYHLFNKEKELFNNDLGLYLDQVIVELESNDEWIDGFIDHCKVRPYPEL